MTEQAFRNKFSFKPLLAMMVGIERECFLTRDGQILPIAPEIIPQLDDPMISYELSACQLESHIGPCALAIVGEMLRESEADIDIASKLLNFDCLHLEVAPDDMPLHVYPDPLGRYQQIAAGMPREVLLAACQVTGTHIHIGMPDPDTALAAYNRVVPCWKELAEMGNGSAGRRLAIYRRVVTDPEPKPYASWSAFYQEAKSRGFAENPRNCWDLIRISTHGTIEFRMFGATSDLDKIESWARRCWELCSY